MTAIWGSTFVVVQNLVSRMDVTSYLFWRFAAAAVVLVAVRPRSLWSMSRRQLRHGVLLGLVLGLGYALQTVGLQHTSATVSGFITGMFVVFTPLISGLVLRRRVGRLAWAGVGLATVGLGLLSLRGFALGWGETLTLLCALAYAVHIVGLGEWSTPRDAYALTTVQLLTVAVVAGTMTLPGGGPQLPPDLSAWVAVLFMAVAATAVAFLIQTWAQAHLTATRVAVILTFEPVFAGIFGVLLAGDPVTARTVGGGLFILSAMYLVELGPRGGRDEAVPHLEA